MHPAARGCPPPPNNNATSDTFTYSFERNETFHPFPFFNSLIKAETSTPSIHLPILTIPSWSPVSLCTFSSSFKVIYVKVALLS